MSGTNMYYTEGDEEHFFPIDRNVKAEDISEKEQPIFSPTKTEHPPSQSKVFYPREWTHEQVAAWLRGLGTGYEQYVDTFQECGINGECLRYVNKDTINSLVKNVLHQKVILHHLKNVIWSDRLVKTSPKIDEENVSEEEVTVSHQSIQSKSQSEPTSKLEVTHEETEKRQSQNLYFQLVPNIATTAKPAFFGAFFRNSKYLLQCGEDLSCGTQKEVAKLYEKEDVTTMPQDGQVSPPPTTLPPAPNQPQTARISRTPASSQQSVTRVTPQTRRREAPDSTSSSLNERNQEILSLSQNPESGGLNAAQPDPYQMPHRMNGSMRMNGVQPKKHTRRNLGLRQPNQFTRLAANEGSRRAFKGLHHRPSRSPSMSPPQGAALRYDPMFEVGYGELLDLADYDDVREDAAPPGIDADMALMAHWRSKMAENELLYAEMAEKVSTSSKLATLVQAEGFGNEVMGQLGRSVANLSRTFGHRRIVGEAVGVENRHFVKFLLVGPAAYSQTLHENAQREKTLRRANVSSLVQMKLRQCGLAYDVSKTYRDPLNKSVHDKVVKLILNSSSPTHFSKADIFEGLRIVWDRLQGSRRYERRTIPRAQYDKLRCAAGKWLKDIPAGKQRPTIKGIMDGLGLNRMCARIVDKIIFKLVGTSRSTLTNQVENGKAREVANLACDFVFQSTDFNIHPSGTKFHAHASFNPSLAVKLYEFVTGIFIKKFSEKQTCTTAVVCSRDASPLTPMTKSDVELVLRECDVDAVDYQHIGRIIFDEELLTDEKAATPTKSDPTLKKASMDIADDNCDMLLPMDTSSLTDIQTTHDPKPEVQTPRSKHMPRARMKATQETLDRTTSAPNVIKSKQKPRVQQNSARPRSKPRRAKTKATKQNGGPTKKARSSRQARTKPLGDIQRDSKPG